MRKVFVLPELPNSIAELQPDSLAFSIIGQPDTPPGGGAGWQSFQVPDSVPDKNGAWIRFRQEGREPYYAFHGILHLGEPLGFNGVLIDIFPAPKMTGVLRPFRLDGQFPRYLDDNSEMLAIESTGFRLGARFLSGQFREADAFCQSLRDHNINTARIATVQDTSLYLPDPRLQYRIHPADDPRYYEKMYAFTHDYLPSWGIYPSLILFTQTQTIMPDPQAQAIHKARMMEVMRDVPGWVADVNENDTHDNRVDDKVLAMRKLAGSAFVHSTGSNSAGAKIPPSPVKDAIEFHTNDLSEWQRKAKDTMDIANGFGTAGWTSEKTRTDKDGNLRHFEDDADVSASMTAMVTIHTPEGKNADPFSFSLAHLDAFNRGIAKGGVSYRRGRYSRTETNPPEVIRVYHMTVDGLGTHTIEVGG